jgi:hypothetical protein
MWSAPAERSGDGALGFERLQVAIVNPKRCRATLATALQSLDTIAGFWLNARDSPHTLVGFMAIAIALSIEFSKWRLLNEHSN